MSQKTHYQDDLFILSVLLKALDASLSVDADPEFFREHIIGDIVFLDSTIHQFSSMLVQNSHMLERAEYVKLLDRTARGFTALVAKLLSGEYPHSEAFASYAPQLEAIRRDEAGIVAELAPLLKASLDGEAEADLVSSDELSELLRGS